MPFPTTLTTMAFDHSSSWWFEAKSCNPTSRSRPSSLLQHGSRKEFLLSLVFVAHRCHNNFPWLTLIAGNREYTTIVDILRLHTDFRDQCE
jgi:hypothetical protein